MTEDKIPKFVWHVHPENPIREALSLDSAKNKDLLSNILRGESEIFAEIAAALNVDDGWKCIIEHLVPQTPKVINFVAELEKTHYRGEQTLAALASSPEFGSRSLKKFLDLLYSNGNKHTRTCASNIKSRLWPV